MVPLKTVLAPLKTLKIEGDCLIIGSVSLEFPLLVDFDEKLDGIDPELFRPEVVRILQ